MEHVNILAPSSIQFIVSINEGKTKLIKKISHLIIWHDNFTEQIIIVYSSYIHILVYLVYSFSGIFFFIRVFLIRLFYAFYTSKDQEMAICHMLIHLICLRCIFFIPSYNFKIKEFPINDFLFIILPSKYLT